MPPESAENSVPPDFDALRGETLEFVNSCALDGCRYVYSAQSSVATLYSSCYAAAARSLYGDLDGLSAAERGAWAAYLNSHQDEDGLYRDPVIFGQGWYAGDPLWCGRTHQTCHAIIALTALGAVAEREFALVAEFSDTAYMLNCLDSRDFGERVAWSGNEIMNVGTLLQYARDFHNDARAGRAVELLLDWLDGHHINPATGVWGTLDVSDPLQRSHAVQAAYHWWPLYFYDQRPIPYPERALDTVLATQNPLGGFGWGVHNSAEPYASSACEDIDSIDPLCRISQLTQYRREDVDAALRRAVPAVLSNRTPDGGFQFIRGRAYEYGHPEFASGPAQGAMFPTWFRTLSLALIGMAMPQEPIGRMVWQFVRCPGYQFWGSDR